MNGTSLIRDYEEVMRYMLCRENIIYDLRHSEVSSENMLPESSHILKLVVNMLSMISEILKLAVRICGLRLVTF